jgi:DNA-binding transcriptional MerR regulator
MLIGRRSRNRESQSSVAETPIPDKLYFRIGEVSEMAQTKPYVLRYWETEFPTLRPMKARSGHRLYRRKDVEMVFQIKQLLYEQGFTINGARKHLENPEAPRDSHSVRPALDGFQLKAIKRELQAILTTLSRKC